MRNLQSDRLPSLALRLLILTSVVLIATGCGEETAEPSTTEEAALSEEEYVTQIREAIQPVQTESQDLVEQVATARKLEDIAQPLGEVARAYHQAANELRAIDPPDDVAEQHERLVQAQEDVADALTQAQQAAKRGDPSAVEQVRSAAERYAEVTRRLSQEFGERGIEL